jgi:hypothetical protein
MSHPGHFLRGENTGKTIADVKLAVGKRKRKKKGAKNAKPKITSRNNPPGKKAARS